MCVNLYTSSNIFLYVFQRLPTSSNLEAGLRGRPRAGHVDNAPHDRISALFYCMLPKTLLLHNKDLGAAYGISFRRLSEHELWPHGLSLDALLPQGTSPHEGLVPHILASRTPASRTRASQILALRNSSAHRLLLNKLSPHKLPPHGLWPLGFLPLPHTHD